jgi:hypothetical protein
VADYDVGTLAVGAVVLGKEAGVCLHVIVNEQQDFSLRCVCTFVSGGCRSTVGLFDNPQRKWR